MHSGIDPDTNWRVWWDKKTGQRVDFRREAPAPQQEYRYIGVQGSIYTCQGCGSLVNASGQKLHDRWHWDNEKPGAFRV